jgi:hypothetical protein
MDQVQDITFLPNFYIKKNFSKTAYENYLWGKNN